MNRKAELVGRRIATFAALVLLAPSASPPIRASQPPTHLVVPPTPDDVAPAYDPRAFRVCADPNNLPFSNERREGFENEIAALVAHDLGRPIEYFWYPQRRGFIRTTLNAHRCDVVMGVPAHFDLARTTHPYYRSTYVFVSRRLEPPLRSFDDPRLKHLRIGIQITGEDYGNPPPAHALASRHLASRVQGFTVYGDYSQAAPQRAVVDAVANGVVDTAIVWGPIGGYFAAREPAPLEVERVDPSGADGPSVPLAFDISVGVRRDDRALGDRIDAVIARRRAEIRRILRRFHIPLVEED